LFFVFLLQMAMEAEAGTLCAHEAPADAAATLRSVLESLHQWSMEGPPRNPRATAGSLATELESITFIANELDHLRSHSDSRESELTCLQVQASAAERKLTQMQHATAERDRELRQEAARREAALCVESAWKHACSSISRSEREAMLHDRIASLEALQRERESMQQEDRRLEDMRSQLEAESARAAASAREIAQLQYRESLLAAQVASVLSPVTVMCRMRPAESYVDGRSALSVDGCEITVEDSGRSRKFRVDRVLEGKATQEEVFAVCAPWVETVMMGSSACVMAYGATGAGKTYTLEGGAAKTGIAFQSLRRLLCGRAVRLSMVEVYCDQLRDLLANSDAGPVVLQGTRRDGQGRMVLDCVELVANNFQEAEEALMRGYRQRTSDSTLCNDQSSRSHVVVTVQMIPADGGTGGRLTLVDLAGSENVQRSGADEGGKLLTEAKAINRSLSALADVVEAIAKKQPFIPYRNSRLTMLLEEPLNSAKVLLLAHVSPLARDATDSGHSLTFAGRVRSVDFGAQQLRKDHEERLKAAHSRDQQEIRQLQAQCEALRKDRDSLQQSTLDLKQQVSTVSEQLREKTREIMREQARSARLEKTAREQRYGVNPSGQQPMEPKPSATRIHSPFPADVRKDVGRRRANVTPMPRRGARDGAGDGDVTHPALERSRSGVSLNQSYGGRSPLADRTNSPAPGNDVKKAVGEVSKVQRLRPPSPHLSVVNRSRSDDPGLSTPPVPQSEKFEAARDGLQSPVRTRSPTTQSPREVRSPCSRSPCSLSPPGPRLKSPSERGVLECQETQRDARQEVYHTYEGVVVRSAIRRTPSDFGRRRARRRESLGTEVPARRVTFAEEEPKLKSPPKWYLDCELRVQARTAVGALSGC